MPPTSTQAIILHTFPYGETSKIARLLTRDHGVQSVMAKGALRPKGKFGARLQVFSTGVAQIYFKRNRDLHTLAEFDVVKQRQELTADVRRYAAAAAFAEVILRFFPAESHPEVFDLTEEVLGLLVSVAAEHLDVVGLGAMWASVSALGFAPRSDACARDGRALPAAAVVFSVADGGFLCTSCARGIKAARLSASDRETLERFIQGAIDAVGDLSPKNAEAHRRLVTRFIERHVAEGKELKALALWQELA
jgi:DNA repair protein RecO (recombination protein O)